MHETSSHKPDQNTERSTMLGSNQSGMRAHNEKLVLSLIRKLGALPKVEIARHTGLSAQTVSVIMRALEADGLLIKGEPVRGKVGQPSVPMSLAPDGAYALGMKIGRRSNEIVLINFVGAVVDRVQMYHRYPTPENCLDFARHAIARITEKLSDDQISRIAGLGIAMPFKLWNWADSLGLSAAEMEGWRDLDIGSALQSSFAFPVYVTNDASAACGAELVFGDAHLRKEFLYFYVGFFIGGGIVLNGSLFTGRSGNAGALGSSPVPLSDGALGQLIDVASLSNLERNLAASGYETDALWRTSANWDFDEDVLESWIAEAANGIACVVASAASVVDFEAALIEGWMPKTVKLRLTTKVVEMLSKMNLAGIEPPLVLAGSAGADARCIGAASIPLSDRFLLDQNPT